MNETMEGQTVESSGEDLLEVESNASDSPSFSLGDGIKADESESASISDNSSGESVELPSTISSDLPSGDFLGYAVLIDGEETTEEVTEPEFIEVQAPVYYSAVSAQYTVYGSYADLTITHNGDRYEFLIPSEQLDKLIIEVGNDGSLILINNSGSNVVLQGKQNYESSDALSFYQLTVPAANLANSVWNNGGYCYITTYYENSYGNISSQNNYLSNPLTGSMSTDNLSEDYTSTPSFYSFVMCMLFLLVALQMVLTFKWRSKIRD